MNKEIGRAWLVLAGAGIAYCLGSATEAASLRAGVGTAYLEEGGEAKQVVEAAFAQAWERYGEQPARCVFVLENVTPPNDRALPLAPLVFSAAKGAPVYGANMGSGDYRPHDLPGGFRARRGMTVLILGGELEIQAESEPMGAVRYPKNTDREANPEQYQADLQTMIDHRQKPGEALAKRFKWGPDANLLLVVGQLHNPEITHLANGMRDLVPEGVVVAGGATQGGFVYLGDKAAFSTVLGVRLSGKFRVGQVMRGPSWGQGEKVDATRAAMLKSAFEELNAALPKPQLVLGFICASWEETALEALHAGVRDGMPPGAAYFGTFSGGEMGRGPKGLAGGGAFAVFTALQAAE